MRSFIRHYNPKFNHNPNPSITLTLILILILILQGEFTHSHKSIGSLQTQSDKAVAYSFDKLGMGIVFEKEFMPLLAAIGKVSYSLCPFLSLSIQLTVIYLALFLSIC